MKNKHAFKLTKRKSWGIKKTDFVDWLSFEVGIYGVCVFFWCVCINCNLYVCFCVVRIFIILICRIVDIECWVQYRDTKKSRCEIKYNHPKLLSNIQYRVPFFTMRFHLHSIKYLYLGSCRILVIIYIEWKSFCYIIIISLCTGRPKKGWLLFNNSQHPKIIFA